MAIQYPMALQKVSEDKKYRLTVWYEEGAMHPLMDHLDFPLHMDDWSHDYSARPFAHSPRHKNKDDHCESRESRMRYLLSHYGDRQKIVALLKKNGRAKTHGRYDCALIWNVGRKEWLLCQWEPSWKGYDGTIHQAHWEEVEYYTCRPEIIDVIDLAYDVPDDCLADLIEHCLTDEVKVMSYGFSYDGDISFYSQVYDDSEGIAWIVRSETVGGGKWLTEEQWATEDCYSLTAGEREEICAWASGEVYWFEVEKNVRWKVHRECLSEERPAEDYEQEEWEQVDSCGGFYGDVKYAVECAIEMHNLPKMIEVS